MSREARVGDAALYPNEDGLIERRLFLRLGSESPKAAGKTHTPTGNQYSGLMKHIKERRYLSTDHRKNAALFQMNVLYVSICLSVSIARHPTTCAVGTVTLSRSLGIRRTDVMSK